MRKKSKLLLFIASLFAFSVTLSACGDLINGLNSFFDPGSSSDTSVDVSSNDDSSSDYSSTVSSDGTSSTSSSDGTSENSSFVTPYIPVSKVEFNKTSITINAGNTFQVHAIVYPEYATNKEVVLSSSNESICTVSETGLITGISGGEATIYATPLSDGNCAPGECKVKVIDKRLRELKLNKNEVTLSPGGRESLTVSYIPEEAEDRAVIWSSDNEDIATVDTSGRIYVSSRAANNDTATITVTSTVHPEIKDSCVVKVYKDESEPVQVNNYTEIVPGYTYENYIAYNVYGLSACPSKGNAKLLVIPVWFTDSESKTGLNSTTRQTVRGDIEKAYFGTNDDTGWRSVKSFYEEESQVYGKPTLSITGTVSEWYECGKESKTYYTSSDATTNLVTTATNWYFNRNPSDNRKNYDGDGDGFMDAIMLIYAYPDYASEGNYNHTNLWAYTYWLQSTYPNTKNPTPNAFFWASYDFMYGSGKKVGKYAAGDTSYCSIDTHAFIHEMGHVFGLQDYYDYSDQCVPGGGLTMQDYNVCGHDPFSVFALGWANPYVVTGNCSIELRPFQSSHELILLSTGWNAWNSPFDEYILIEFYTPSGLNEFDVKHQYVGRPKGVNSYGVRIWHVDGRVVTYSRVSSQGQPVFDASSLTANVQKYPNTGVTHAMSNTYYVSSYDESAGYVSPLGSSYANYNILQMIRNSTYTSYKPTNLFADSDLFKSGSSFTTSRYSKQFVNGSKMNNGSTLKYTVNVNNVTQEYASIEIIAQ